MRRFRGESPGEITVSLKESTEQMASAAELLTCLRWEEPAQKTDRLAAFTPEDWTAAVRQARAHGLAPYLYWRLHQLPARPDIPADLWAGLRKSLLTNARRNTLLFLQLGEALAALNRAGVPVIVLKGAHLAALVYADIGLRPMGDIDLLIPEAHLQSADRILRTLGYTPHQAVHFDDRGRHHLPPYQRAKAATIEVHWTITAPQLPFEIAMEDLWKQAQPVDIANSATMALAPAGLLIHLCIHLCAHQLLLGLHPLVDLLETLIHHGKDLDWQALVAISQRANLCKQLYLPLSLAHHLLGAPVPTETLELLQPADFSPQIAALARQRITAEQRLPAVHPGLAALWGQRPLSARIRPFLRSSFPPPAKLADRYALSRDSKIVYLYYPVLFKDLLTDYGAQLWGLVRGDSMTRAIADRNNQLVDWLLSP